MKILIYNWADYLNNPSRGGGVTVYLRRLISELKKKHHVIFVSSGESYNPFRAEPYWVKRKGEQNVDIYEIVNSEILAPANLELGSNSVLYAENTLAVWFDLLIKIKPDVVHFHNIEGLPIKALKVKDILKNCAVFYSLHNYYGFCANVKLWKNNERNCDDLDDKESCLHCCKEKPDVEVEYKVKVIKWVFRMFKLEVPKWVYKYTLGIDFISYIPGRLILSKLLLVRRNDRYDYLYRDIKESFVEHLNNCCDLIMPVSNRVAIIAEKHGVWKEKMETCYIGTDLVAHKPVRSHSTKLAIVYMGYMSKEKGFDFFIETLSRLPINELKKINLTIAAKNCCESSYKKMMSLADCVNYFKYFDGYSRFTQDQILSGADLSIVPVLWEDNLPQVAIESVMHGVPIFVSDLGGAQELTGCDSMFTFKHGDELDFINKLCLFINNKDFLNHFWTVNIHIPNMDEHVYELFEKYRATGIC